MKKILVYDLEIVKAIPGKREAKIPGIEYCEGWGDHADMGISVLSAWTLHDDTYHVFCQDNFGAFQDLVDEMDEIVGFNSEQFDDKVCEANGIMVKTTYDILRKVYAAIGRMKKGYGLDPLAKANGLGAKIGHGAVAPVLWQQGKYGEVINYCLRDVRMTRGLLGVIIDFQHLRDPHSQEFIPMEFEAMPAQERMPF